jgi:hypothetical protein
VDSNPTITAKDSKYGIRKEGVNFISFSTIILTYGGIILRFKQFYINGCGAKSCV